MSVNGGVSRTMVRLRRRELNRQIDQLVHTGHFDTRSCADANYGIFINNSSSSDSSDDCHSKKKKKKKKKMKKAPKKNTKEKKDKHKKDDESDDDSGSGGGHSRPYC